MRMRIIMGLSFIVLLCLFSPAFAAGGDVYQIKSIIFPQLYQGNPITADINIVNTRLSDPTYPGSNPTILYMMIRHQDGTVIANSSYPLVWNPLRNWQVITIPIDNAAAPTLMAGETYTLYASVRPYSVAGNVETVTANNAASGTFTELKQPATIPVPDNSIWMSMGVVLMVMSWLVVSTRTKN